MRHLSPIRQPGVKKCIQGRMPPGYYEKSTSSIIDSLSCIYDASLRISQSEIYNLKD